MSTKDQHLEPAAKVFYNDINVADDYDGTSISICFASRLFFIEVMFIWHNEISWEYY